MPSRADTMRVPLERALRALVLLILAFAAWSASRPASVEELATSGGEGLATSLERWTAVAPHGVHLSLGRAPDQEARDWVRAIRRAGTRVTWGNEGIRPIAVELAPVANPRGGWMLWTAAPRGARIAVADAITPIDTVVASQGGARVFAPMITGPVTATVDRQRASAGVRDTLLARRILVLGHVGWEAKFVIAALEETGWAVDARLSVAPGVEITQGAPRLPDTTRHAAVVVLDRPAASTASAIARYVRDGGGAVLSGAAVSAGPLGDIGAGRVGARVRASSIAFADAAPRRALGFLSIAPRADAIVLEERDGRVAAAARRVDAGRLIQLGYDESWRWRLGGGAPAVEAHRAWWSALVSSVAYRPAVALSHDVPDEDAPLARLVDVLGPAAAAPPAVADRARWAPSPVLLFVLISGLLLAELASRRLRGAP